MSSYFDEHNCEEGSRPDGLLQLARLLVDTGAAADAEFERLFLELIGRGETSTPPASEAVIKDIPRIPPPRTLVQRASTAPSAPQFARAAKTTLRVIAMVSVRVAVLISGKKTTKEFASQFASENKVGLVADVRMMASVSAQITASAVRAARRL